MDVRRLQVVAGALWGLMILTVVFRVGASPACAQPAAAPAAPPQVQELLKLLDDPATRTWIDQQRQSAAPPREPTSSEPQGMDSQMLATRVEALRAHLAALAAAVPRLPQEAARAADLLAQELRSRSLLDVMILILGFLGLGAGVEWLFRKATVTAHDRSVFRPVQTAAERVRVTVSRMAFGLAHVAIFGIGSIGAFLVFDWPPLLKRIVLAYLFAALLLRLALLGGRILLAPEPVGYHDPAALRVIPINDGAARFWYRRLVLFVGWFTFGWATVELVHALGFSPDGRRLVAYVLGLGLLVLAVEAVWRWPLSTTLETEKAEHPPRHHVLGTWLLSLYLVLLWGLWVAGLMGLFWLLIVVVVLPQAVKIMQRSVRHLLRPSENAEADNQAGLSAVYLDRGIRALLIVAAALFLAEIWNVDLVELTSRDTVGTRLVRGALSSIVILLVADLIWQIVKTHIDLRLSRLQAEAPSGSEAALSQARVRTLLPMFRMAAFIILAAVAVLMTLSSLGVDIGPLIAGAGIFGVAIGFGSQTLVRDIISGIFYLLDDAFRVGEYIQSGSYKGTVEKLGFRSVKLRHHRGPVFTIPYGQLGAVENMSRDWVIDKLTVGVSYDSDFDKAKKLIKQIGKDLAEDPEFAPHIIEPLKMQGVEQFGDYGIQIRLKMMTKPGEQFVIRRRALALIKKAFDENGIRFALPTVQVAGRDEAEPAAARQALKLVKGAPPEESA
ncbi:mechanosensitive ion channel family protein [Microvirga guangxiensis]|uniref:Small-conductance mechanosensitive channel n=1 Tax=Microvirga guangxiensis TaxID=549386 RepID=A0A1G5AXL1_9HYPH|nr:mechanosensitive ion channel family protein [Microvirga guangxiensis]SCX82584.1 Small-conductance mechanosensitive channel [Microvirga guangxiensis]